MDRGNWINQEKTPEGIRITVVQQQWTPMRRSLILIGIATFSIAILLLCQNGNSGFSLIVSIICGIIAFLMGAPGIIALPIAFFVGINRSSRSVFIIGNDTILFMEKPTRSNPDPMQLDEISGIFCSCWGNEQSSLEFNEYQSNSIGYLITQLAGMLKDIFQRESHYVGINYKGKKVDLAVALSEDEADYLYQQIKTIIC